MNKFTRKNSYSVQHKEVRKIEKMISDEIDRPNTDIHKLRILDLKRMKTIDELKRYRI